MKGEQEDENFLNFSEEPIKTAAQRAALPTRKRGGPLFRAELYKKAGGIYARSSSSRTRRNRAISPGVLKAETLARRVPVSRVPAVW